MSFSCQMKMNSKPSNSQLTARTCLGSPAGCLQESACYQHADASEFARTKLDLQ